MILSPMIPEESHAMNHRPNVDVYKIARKQPVVYCLTASSILYERPCQGEYHQPDHKNDPMDPWQLEIPHPRAWKPPTKPVVNRINQKGDQWKEYRY